MPGYLSDGALRCGRIPGSIHIHWEEFVDGQFAVYKSKEEMLKLLADNDIQPDDELILYCRVGKRSSHNWFILTKLLGFTNVKNYDSGWLEWGNLMEVPIER